MTYDTQRTSQPAKESECLVEEDGGEDGGDDDGERPEWSLGDDGVSGLASEPGPPRERGRSWTDDDDCFNEGISCGNGEMELRVEAGEGGETNQQSCRSLQVSSLFPDRGCYKKGLVKTTEEDGRIMPNHHNAYGARETECKRERDPKILEGHAPI